MRILHTSDWHLGIQLKQASRQQELQLFLEWLEETLQTEQVDVLLHAGDVFHQALPSARAQRQLYDFLDRASQIPTLKHMIFVGGNHDSASRLEAPQNLLKKTSIHVVGGFWNRPEDYDNYLFPLTDDQGEVKAVVVALPYIQEARLGLSAIGLSAEEHRQRYCEAFTKLYSDFADLAVARHPQAALVGMGHLTCGTHEDISDDDYMSEIHSIGALGTLPPSIFDERYDYVALGHIHRCFRVGSRQVWYSGTPIPMRFNETNAPRRILLLDTEPDPATLSSPEKTVKVTPIRVPTWRQLLRWEGDESQILSHLDLLAWSDDFPPFLEITLLVDQVQYGALNALNDKITERFPESARPRIVEFRQQLKREEEDSEQVTDLRLEDMTPLQVFTQLYCSRHGQQELPDSFKMAFLSLLNSEQEESTQPQPAGETAQ